MECLVSKERLNSSNFRRRWNIGSDVDDWADRTSSDRLVQRR